jgi:OmpA-OmpF porin, OOP family
MQEVVHLITGSPGGVSGFIDKFRTAGLGSEVASWLGRTDGAALAGPQVERALGSTALGGIASRLGIGSGVVATAIGYILPKLIGQITPAGSSQRASRPRSLAFSRQRRFKPRHAA